MIGLISEDKTIEAETFDRLRVRRICRVYIHRRCKPKCKRMYIYQGMYIRYKDRTKRITEQ